MGEIVGRQARRAAVVAGGAALVACAVGPIASSSADPGTPQVAVVASSGDLGSNLDGHYHYRIIGAVENTGSVPVDTPVIDIQTYGADGSPLQEVTTKALIQHLDPGEEVPFSVEDIPAVGWRSYKILGATAPLATGPTHHHFSTTFAKVTLGPDQTVCRATVTNEDNATASFVASNLLIFGADGTLLDVTDPEVQTTDVRSGGAAMAPFTSGTWDIGGAWCDDRLVVVNEPTYYTPTPPAPAPSSPAPTSVAPANGSVASAGVSLTKLGLQLSKANRAHLAKDTFVLKIKATKKVSHLTVTLDTRSGRTTKRLGHVTLTNGSASITLKLATGSHALWVTSPATTSYRAATSPSLTLHAP